MVAYLVVKMAVKLVEKKVGSTVEMMVFPRVVSLADDLEPYLVEKLVV
jgi:hypothetical protein